MLLKKSQEIENDNQKLIELRKLLNKCLYDMEVLREYESSTAKNISKLTRTQENLEGNKNIVKDYEHFNKALIRDVALAITVFAVASIIYGIAEGIVIGSLINQIEVIIPRYLMFLGLPVPAAIGGIYYLATINKENKDIKEILSHYLKENNLKNNKENRLTCVKRIIKKQNKVSERLLFDEEKEAKIRQQKELLQSLIDEICDKIQTDEYQVEIAEMLRQQIGYYASPEEIDMFIEEMLKKNGGHEDKPSSSADFSRVPRTLSKIPNTTKKQDI